MSGGPVPTTRRYQIFIEKAIAVQKVAIRTTSVQHAGAIVEVSIPMFLHLPSQVDLCS